MESSEGEDSSGSSEGENYAKLSGDEHSAESSEDGDNTNDVRKERVESDHEDEVDNENGDSGLGDENKKWERRSDKTKRSRKPIFAFDIENKVIAEDNGRGKLETIYSFGSNF